jgi:hypothetical protein
VFDAILTQVDTGLAVVNDGEQGRADYTIYVKEGARLASEELW